MRFFPVVNLSPRLGQVKEFPILPDAALARICGAVEEYNEWKDWADTPTGDRHIRDAIANVQSMINTVRPDFQKGAAQEISKYCPDSDDLIGHLNVFQGTTPPAIPPSQTMVATGDTSRTYPPPPPNTNPPVATGAPGPGAGAFKPQPPVASTDFPFHRPYVPPGEPGPNVTGEPVTTGFTGSEPEPEPVPPSPAQPPMTPPPVATEGAACYYVIGQGYSWGARPSGGETTGLNKRDCEAIQANYNSVRGLSVQNLETPPVQATQFTQDSNQVAQAPTAPSMQPAIETRPDVASTMCPPGQFWDGRKCRGSVDTSAGGIFGQAMNLGPSGASLPAGNVAFGGEGFSSGGAPGEFSMVGRVRPNMGRRSFPVVNL